ncbi:MAG TPA: ABC transporter substrate-binding protein [Pseudonocardiaceae bacterium]|nr:ABC transporter substrate-binding protein [Pseudonocardiaceae bacterium]
MRLAFPAVALSSLLALVGCTTSTGHSAAPHKPAKSTASTVTDPKPRKLTTGPGVTQTDITLGALVGYSGPFADESIAVLHGQQIWINDTNAAGGVCGRKIKLEVRDGQGDITKAKAQYTGLEPKVLGFLQIQGSAVAATLSQSLIDNETTAVALSSSSELLRNPYMIIPTTTYDIGMINGLSALLAQGKIHDGDTIGHVWLDGDDGANGLRGVQYFAQRHHMTLRATRVTVGSDMREVVAGFAAAPRVKAIALSTTPAQTASVATLNQELRLGVPMIGNSPVFTPQLLVGPIAGALANLSVVASSVPFSAATPKAQHVASAYQQAGYPELPSSGVPYGYATATIWGQVLKRACSNGDLNRSGIQEALHQLDTINADNLVTDLSFAKPGSPATRQTYLGIPDPAVPGGIRQASPVFESPETQGYVAPFQGAA